MASAYVPGVKPEQQRQQSAGPVSPITAALEPIIQNAKPAIVALLKLADAAGPYIQKAWDVGQDVWARLQPYKPQDFMPLIFGLLLIFFGGHFPITVAAIEAFRICGWDNTKKALMMLYQQYTLAMAASRKDDLVDENKDGIADVKQIDAKTYVSRKVAVFLKSTDPSIVNTGVQGLAAGCSAVVATLRLQFAQTITLGVSLGDVFCKAADQVLRPALEKVVPLEYHKWIGMAISYGCRSVAVSIAWWCQRIISALHSAMRGAQLVLKGVDVLAARFQIRVPVDLSPANSAYPAICGALGSVGLYTQLSTGFALPFPFSILCFPLRIIEWALWYFLAYGK